MGTGYHSVVSASLRPGKTVIIVGDGAVGLCAVLSAKILGAGRIILMGHNPDRLKLGQRFGATDIINARDDAQAVVEAVQMTGGGAESVAECVGLKSSFDLAIGVARPGGVVGFVGVPHVSSFDLAIEVARLGGVAGFVGVPHVTEAIDLGRMFSHNISLRGGVAPVRAYIPDLMAIAGFGNERRSQGCSGRLCGHGLTAED
jgi:threonine dehydrogenase-like Zn-dependent dehydrogenase